ncbi:hypothetical protein Z517_09214 [Fonsecaea pedrosoi CBS 271.37]|uniref:Uncharacterized protein n=1 Tax=Fonsecaea pedrosoi CBS 271.37 TaxID=1442368 RepID=A0A0D2GDJ8_9EURO|nr:uncharacterized protein Z517_09214 [Fonsecaea pedrosoi CBS 271.37]KIW76770.1 hypothetical protein Z517_09214 [Fonsecaea pedrosoi CBS 271.37]
MAVQLGPNLTNAVEGLVAYMAHAYALMGQVYASAFTQARDWSDPMQNLFRQVCWALMCMASCSRDYVKLANAEETGWSDIVGECMSKAASFTYGILGARRADQSTELMSAFLVDFHDDERSRGSAPSSSWSWMGSFLVWLTSDLLSRSSFASAICAAVAKGRAEGKHIFQVLVFSLQHPVYVDVTPKAVVHSKRYAMWTQPADGQVSYLQKTRCSKTLRK